MKKNMEKKVRFMPNIKFKPFPQGADADEILRIGRYIKELPSCGDKLYHGYRTNNFGDIIYNGFENQEGMDNYNGNVIKEVSVYEAIPELVPDGMVYDKESGSLIIDPKPDKNLDVFNGLADAFKNWSLTDTLKLEKDVFERSSRKEDSFADQILSSDFVKFDSNKPMFHLIDPFAMEDLAKCLTFGAKKYDANNWKKGDILTFISALERHLNDIKKGILLDDSEFFIDKDSALQHGAALMCNSMFIHYFIEKKLKGDIKNDK